MDINLLKALVFVILHFVPLQLLLAQNLTYPKTHIQHLTSPKMAGRGYVQKGDKKAARYIAHELKKMGVFALNESYFQKFSFPMNTFPGNMELHLDKNKLTPVYDFVVSPSCKSTQGTFPLIYLPAAADTLDALYDSLIREDYSGKFVVAPFPSRKIIRANPFHASGVLIPNNNLYWWASNGHKQEAVPLVIVADSLLKKHPASLSLNIETKFIKKYDSQNVCAFIKGSVTPDSFIVFSAHYDHLGMMGKGAIFRGANDNASGTAMVLWLANYFSKPENAPAYSLAFLFFAAEESGLLGSQYYVKNPLFPLTNIKALINLDMVGTGSEGISLVNGLANPEIAGKIQALNNEHHYFSGIQIRGEACNSDHCHFHEAGVPAIFIYTKGPEYTAYHNLEDVPEKLPLTKYVELYQLLIGFTAAGATKADH